MKRSKEMVQKYQQQQNKLLSNNADLAGQEHSSFAKMNNSLYSNLSSPLNQMNSTKSPTMASSIFSSCSSSSRSNAHTDHLPHHDPMTDYREETIRHMLKNNYPGLSFNDLIQLPYKPTTSSAFNLVKKDVYRTNALQIHSPMMSDEAFAEDLSDDHTPVDDDQFMSDEQISEDEQPLDFSIKSKKDDHECNTNNGDRSSILSNSSRSSIDQVDGDWSRLNSKFHSHHPQSTASMFNSLSGDSALTSFYASQYAPKLNNSSGLSTVGQSSAATANSLMSRYPFMNPLLLNESQSLIHSEPSSPEGLSSSSSTSSRSSSQGYYSGSSLSGGHGTSFNLPSALNIAPSIYSNMLNQSLSSSVSAKSSTSFMQTAPPSYASLNFSNQPQHTNHNSSKQSSSSARNSTSSSNQQVRPSVIVSINSKTSNANRQQSAFASREPTNSTKLNSNGPDKIVDSIEEHFRLSLGDSYKKMINSQSTPTKDSFSQSTQQSPSVSDHFNRSLSHDSSSTTMESSTSVDDHFAKALGETWFKLKKDSLS